MKETEIQDELASIRSLMERSSKFISLSGLSGILAGVYALIGAGLAYNIIQTDPLYIHTYKDSSVGLFYGCEGFCLPTPVRLLVIAGIVLIASILTGIILSIRKAKRKGQSFWSKTSRELLFHMAVPLIAGGLVIIIFIARGYYGVVVPVSLIFYGLALVAAGNFTFAGVKSLGLCEIILGLIAALFPGYGLYFWAFGFGILHIIYGSVMYLKYDR
jgi:hypothetical protein